MNRKSLATFGTQFESLEDEQKDTVSKTPKSIYDQVATDERGRRRFHGAFTGGFSAGFFNSVGSKKGWYPQAFKSTRSERHDSFQQTPEDFMDAEDLGEFGISSRKIRQTQTFRGEDSNKRRFAWDHGNVTSSSLAVHLEDIVRPVSDSVGVQMLREMGWRQGRGVGLEMNFEKARRGHDETDRAQTLRIAKGAELSVEDSLVEVLKSIEGLHGLGYTGLQSTSILNENFGQTSAALKSGRKSRGISGQAFGVGVFEDDDENVYTNFDLSQYDFALDGPSQAPDAAKIDSTFTTSTGRVPPRKFYAAPRIPHTFKPTHKPIALDQSRLPKQVQKTMERLHPVQRAKLLGLDRINYMEAVADKDRARLKNRGDRRSRWDLKPKEEEGPEAFVNREAFPDEPMKQRRFKEFLYYLKRGLPYPQPTDMSVWEWDNEKKEFEQQLTTEERGMLPEVRARMQPLANTALAMPLQELLQSKFVSEKGNSEKHASKDEDKMAAVRMGMFGSRTRITYEWRPHKTLAKIFNVPNPFPGSHYVGCAHLQREGRSKETIVNLGLPNTQAELAFKEQQRGRYDDSKEDLKIKTESEEPTSDELQQEEQQDEGWERPPMDIFEAIFADLEDEDEEEELEVSKTKDEPPPSEKKIQETSSTRPLPEVPAGSSRQQEFSPTTPPGSPPASTSVEEKDDEVTIGPEPPPQTDRPDAISVATVYKYLRDGLRDKKKAKKEKKEKSRHKKKKSKKDKHKHSKYEKTKKKSTEESDSSGVEILSD
ncbi:unnamed protein product, partial [Mesorhabditis belari]|uniref:G-patch domain-containing protein n=1 Tax=Mesorhabditis belari TaxID=2138241 RepID=A0AAF3EA97_9BILA